MNQSVNLHSGFNYKGEEIPSSSTILSIVDKKKEELLANLSSTTKCIIVNHLISNEKLGLKEIRESIQQIASPLGYNNKDGIKKESDDYKGLYLFAEKTGSEVKPVYLGISRRIIKRLRGHLLGLDYNTSTWVYSMLDKDDQHQEILRWKASNPIKKERDRKWLGKLIENKRNDYFKKLILTIALVDDSYCLYTAEALLAANFKTKWNSFRTH